MIKIENVVLPSAEQWNAIIMGTRNPMNSWNRSDSYNWHSPAVDNDKTRYEIGSNDHDLMMRLAKNGPVHAKYRRMITVYLDITAPLYWWKEFDTYKVGTVANSCSTMHKIQAKEFTLDDFSHEHLISDCLLEHVINELNIYRDIYNNYDKQTDEYKFDFSKKDIWWQMIQLLPSSYNQKRTVMLNYETLANMYKSRKDHKLDEWHTFCHWIEELPYSEIITGYEEKDQ